MMRRQSMIPSNSRNVPPKASAMIEALRGLGYTAASALADLIDNSISARARERRNLVLLGRGGEPYHCPRQWRRDGR